MKKNLKNAQDANVIIQQKQNPKSAQDTYVKPNFWMRKYPEYVQKPVI